MLDNVTFQWKFIFKIRLSTEVLDKTAKVICNCFFIGFTLSGKSITVDEQNEIRNALKVVQNFSAYLLFSTQTKIQPTALTLDPKI